MDYVICKNVLSATKDIDKKKYLGDLLFPLTSNHSLGKVVKNITILNEYKSIADENLTTWIAIMTDMGRWKEMDCDENPIFIKTCKKLHCGKLIVNEREDYTKNEYDGLEVIDKDEAIIDIQPKSSIIYMIGDDNQASIGDNSGTSKTF